MNAHKCIMCNLNIAFWNANGLQDKIQELTYFLEKYKIDIMLLSETKLTNKIKIKIKNYKVYRKDRSNNTPYGGVVILAKNNIPAAEIPTNTISMETVAIKISDGHVIISTYIPPSNKIDTKELSTLFNMASKVLVAGDLNSKHTTWNCKRNNRNGNIIYTYTMKYNVNLGIPDSHTHFPYANNTIPSTIDIAIYKNVNLSTLESICELHSDHNPVITQIAANASKTQNTNSFKDYDNADWNKFKYIINSKLRINNQVKTKAQIEVEIKNCTELIQRAANKAIPTIKSQKTRTLPTYILNLIKERNKIRKKHQQMGHAQLKQQQNTLTHQIKKEIKEHQNEKWNKRLREVKPNNNTLWHLTKYLKQTNNNISTLHGTQGLIFTNEDKAEALAENFAKVHNLTENLSDASTENEINTQYHTIIQKSPKSNEIKFTSPKEIISIIKNSKSRKAPGPDNIQNIILKNLPKKMIVQLTYIFNACLKLTHFPTQWKNAHVLAFPKPNKDKLFPQNYRPISLLTTLSKTLENIILNRIKAHEIENKQIIPEQFGFRNHHSTTQQLIRITNDISEGFNKNQSTVMAMLDIEKAFDTVWHKALLHKLDNYGLPNYLLLLINSYLTNRTFQVKINSTLSNKKHITAGVPQGSILGPRLFLYHINDIPKNNNVKLAIFADDTALYSTSWGKPKAAEQIQEHLDEILIFFNKWKIKINEAKTETIIFSHKLKNTFKHKTTQKIQVNNTEIEYANHVKYLGVTLDTKLTFTKHIKNTKNKAIIAQRQLYSITKPASKLSIKNKIKIYKTIIKPIMLYAAPVWSNTNNTNIKTLQTIQNKYLRKVTNNNATNITNKSIHENTKTQTMRETIIKHTRNFYTNQTQFSTLLTNMGKVNSSNAPFKLKYKLPHHLIIQ